MEYFVGMYMSMSHFQKSLIFCTYFFSLMDVDKSQSRMKTELKEPYSGVG
jgi:hypothetical protein